VCIRGKIKHQAALDCGALASDHTRSVRRPTLHPPSVNIRVHSWTKEKAVEPCVLHTQRPASQQLAQPLTTHYSLLTTATKSPLPLSLLPARPPCTGACQSADVTESLRKLQGWVSYVWSLAIATLVAGACQSAACSFAAVKRKLHPGLTPCYKIRAATPIAKLPSLTLLPTASAISLKLAKRLTRSALQASARTGPAAAGPTIRAHPCLSVDFLL